MIHPDMPNVPKVEIRKKLAAANKVKEDCVVVYGLKTKYGGGKSSGFALIYDSLDNRKKYDSRKNLLRVILLVLCLYYIIGKTRRQERKELQAEEGNQGKSQESQRYRQSKGRLRWKEEEVSSLSSINLKPIPFLNLENSDRCLSLFSIKPSSLLFLNT